MRNEMNRIQDKDYDIGSHRITMIKMDIVDYHILINVLVNHIKK